MDNKKLIKDGQKMMSDNKVEYIQAYTEVICLLKYFPKEYIDKLPNKLLEMIQNRSDRKYNINVDVKKDLESQNISKKTKDILVVLKYNYWSTDDEKKYFYDSSNKTNINLREAKRECFNSLMNLEAKYPAVTAMISSDIPLLNTVIDYCSPSKMKENTVKVYQLKKK